MHAFFSKRRVLTIKPEKRLKVWGVKGQLGCFCHWGCVQSGGDIVPLKSLTSSAGLKITVFVGFQEASHKQKSFFCRGGRRGGVFESSSELWKHSKHSCGLVLITVPVSLRPLPPPHTLITAICCRLTSFQDNKPSPWTRACGPEIICVCI